MPITSLSILINMFYPLPIVWLDVLLAFITVNYVFMVLLGTALSFSPKRIGWAKYLGKCTKKSERERKRERERERERERKREREKEREGREQTNRQTDGQTDGHTDGYADRQTDKNGNRQAKLQRDRKK